MDKNTKYIKEGLLAEKKRMIARLETQADRYRKDVNIYLFTANGIEGMVMDKATQAFEELTQAVKEYWQTKEEIRRIEEEL